MYDNEICCFIFVFVLILCIIIIIPVCKSINLLYDFFRELKQKIKDYFKS